MKSIDLSVLVPVYNNAATLDELIDRLLVVLEGLDISFEIICVDDGSEDASLALLRRRAAADERLRVFSLVRNFGSQAASCAACDQARGRRIVHIDADLENFPEDIPRLLELLDRGYDLVCGFREDRTDPWLRRRLPSLLINLYVRRQTGTDIRDVGCGLKAFEARLIEDLAAEGEARRLMTPLLLRRARRVAQVPVRHRTKPGNRHAFGWLFAIAVDYYLLTARRPFLITALISTAAFFGGLMMLALEPRLIGLILCVTGALGAILSLVGEYAQRLYQLARQAPFYKLRDL
jgi:glycosyltransferase involved in cell wall biosynthesis